jgi:two-component system OmpR family sensor kinase
VHALAAVRRIELTLEADPAVVQGDREALRTLVRNLVDNAVRYTPEGGRVRIRTRGGARASGGTEPALLEVGDSGPGMAAADRERAFDRFYRRVGSPQGGSGLGLAIVKAIADRHGAEVRLGDAADGGLLVTVAFPPAL